MRIRQITRQLILAVVLYSAEIYLNGLKGFIGVSCIILFFEGLTVLRRYRGVSLPLEIKNLSIGDYVYIWLGKPVYNARPPKNEKEHSILATFLVGRGVSLNTTFRIYHFFRRAFGYPYNWNCQNCNLKISSTSYKELNSIQLAHILTEKDKGPNDTRPGS